jgi:hypothetical protein
MDDGDDQGGEIRISKENSFGRVLVLGKFGRALCQQTKTFFSKYSHLDTSPGTEINKAIRYLLTMLPFILSTVLKSFYHGDESQERNINKTR